MISFNSSKEIHYFFFFFKKLDNDLKIIKELQEKITELDINLDAKQKEKHNLEVLMEENIKQQQALQEKIEEFNQKEKDKDDEITAIQKGLFFC